MFDPQQPRRLQPTRLLRPFGIFQAKVLEWGATAFSYEDSREKEISMTSENEQETTQQEAKYQESTIATVMWSEISFIM